MAAYIVTDRARNLSTTETKISPIWIGILCQFLGSFAGTFALFAGAKIGFNPIFDHFNPQEQIINNADIAQRFVTN